MGFKTYREYIEKKTGATSPISYSVNQYRDAVYADLAKLVLTKTDYFEEAVEGLLNIQRIEKMLHEANYPQKEAVLIALKSGNDEKVQRNMRRLESWLEACKLPKATCALIERACLDYRTKQITKEFEPEDVDSATESFVLDCYQFLDNIKGRIESAAASIDWDAHPVMLEPLPPKKGLKVQQVGMTLGEVAKASYILDRTTEGFVFEESDLSMLPPSLAAQFTALVEKLKQSPRYNKVFTLYLHEPEGKRGLYETKKRDISLGIQTTLPKDTVLSTSPENNGGDIWKIKMTAENLVKCVEEGTFLAYKLLDETRIRWIERLNG